MRFDLQIIASWIEPNATVLDLGCGQGDLLAYLQREKGIRGSGIEQDEEKIDRCIARGLTVVQGDINEEVRDYPDARFDYVVLSQTLQQVYKPAELIREMLRVGRRGIVSFPNFSHWRIRMQLLFKGRAPMTKELPYDWHDTPNIRVLGIKDFQSFCAEKGFPILRQTAIDTDYHEDTGHVISNFAPWRAKYGVYLLGR